ncbi:MAG: RNA polymerase sigma factor [Acidobacteriota bacterium]|nr:MAG: RNA polymerase sigma factor [Acidobacteriota bacterium]
MPTRTKEEMEVEILERVLEGQTSAYAEIFTQHRGRAFALAYQYLQNYEDAKDIVQDAFIKAYQNLGKFDLKRSFGPWLLTIVRNLSIDHLRRQKRVSADGLPDYLADPKSSGKAVQQVLRNEIWTALQSLNENQREIIFLKDYQGHSYLEIAEILDIPLGTVMSRLHHARKNLIAALGITKS